MPSAFFSGNRFLELFYSIARKKNKISQVKSFTIYYGWPSESAMSKLSEYDLVIIEPSNYTDRQIENLKASNTIVIGYISVMESPSWNKARLDELSHADFLLENERKIHFPAWDSYLMDLRRMHYREILLNEIRVFIADKGLDGVFLDTVGDIDDHIHEPFLRAEFRECYQILLRDIHRLYPDLVLIQNRGFDTLDLSAPYVQGILWEDWRYDWRNDPWISFHVKRLLREQKRGLKIFSVSESTDLHCKSSAESLNFIHLSAPGGYVSKVH